MAPVTIRLCSLKPEPLYWMDQVGTIHFRYSFSSDGVFFIPKVSREKAGRGGQWNFFFVSAIPAISDSAVSFENRELERVGSSSHARDPDSEEATKCCAPSAHCVPTV